MATTKVLLVDDERDFVEALARRLTSRGFEIVKAFGGEEALALLEEQDDIEVVLLDVLMPGMDGIETLTRIKLLRPLVEVVMLTGHGTVETAVEGMKLGAFHYLLKPCDIEEITAKVERAAALRTFYEDKLIVELSKPYRPHMSMAELIARIKEEHPAEDTS